VALVCAKIIPARRDDLRRLYVAVLSGTAKAVPSVDLSRRCEINGLQRQDNTV